MIKIGLAIAFIALICIAMVYKIRGDYYRERVPKWVAFPFMFAFAGVGFFGTIWMIVHYFILGVS